jgi:enoyl-CoA hydratase
MARELKAAIERLCADDTVGCLLVRGEGSSFCAGADRELLRTATDPANGAARRDLEDIYQSFIALGTTAVPSIAAVQGWAVGAGLNLALAADVRIATRDSQMLAGFGRLQIHPGGGHLHLLQRLGGTGLAAAMAIFDQPVSGERAAGLGLVWRAVGDDELLDEALALAAGPARAPELARLTTASLRTTSRPDQWQAAIDRERVAQLNSLAQSPVLHP